MTQQYDESIENYINRFQYNPRNALDPETLRIIFLRGLREYCIDILNLTRGRNVSQMSYNATYYLCR